MMFLPNNDDFLKMRLQGILLHRPLQMLKQLSGTALLKMPAMQSSQTIRAEKLKLNGTRAKFIGASIRFRSENNTTLATLPLECQAKLMGRIEKILNPQHYQPHHQHPCPLRFCDDLCIL
jgi:hypothetical protein